MIEHTLKFLARRLLKLHLFQNTHVNKIKKKKKTWKTPSGQNFQSEDPSMQEIVVSYGNTDIIASHIKQVPTDRPQESSTKPEI